jgi:uncharacterized membrane protein YhaH (DUF805 family)
MIMSFSEAVQSGVRRGLDFRSRSSRSEYWWFYLASILFECVVLIVMALAVAVAGNIVGSLVAVAGVVAFLGLTVCGLALTVRRFHDSDRSAWWLLISFVPLVGAVVILIFLVLEGNPGPNRFGPPPGQSAYHWPVGGPPTGSPYGPRITYPSAAPYGNPPPTYGTPPPPTWGAPPPGN